MTHRTTLTFALALALACGACTSTLPTTSTPSPGLRAPLFNDLGDYGAKITTSEPLAQRFFDQGLMLTFGFNHAEAARSYREAARLDPDCAMCYWGIAFALGPNINVPMLPEGAAEAWSASRKALELSARVTPRERALIEALAMRYAQEPPENRAPLDQAFADAMREAARSFPDDPEILTFYAESLMDLSPWDYWTNGQPRPATLEIIGALERVLARNPDHPGANHLYIHTIEASPEPGKAEAAADRLLPLAPGAAHLVHMPGHIYMRVGRYHDAALVNIKAGEADTSYIAQCQAQGVYPLLYHPHNWHFLWFAATFEGDSATARRGAERTRALMGTHQHDDPSFGPVIQHFWLAPLYDAVRFARWDEILATAEPAESPYTRAMWRYAQGMASSARGDAAVALEHLRQLRSLARDPALPSIVISPHNDAGELVAVATAVLEGELAARARDYPRAVASLRHAVALEDALGYNEPADWHFPIRHFLGEVLLDSGDAAAAEKIYREDLARYPENGWSLFGLAQSLQAQGRTGESAGVKVRFGKAWANADVPLHGSMIR